MWALLALAACDGLFFWASQDRRRANLDLPTTDSARTDAASSGDSGPATTPSDGLGEALDVATGSQITCMVTALGDLTCWYSGSSLWETTASDTGPWKAVDVGLDHACALRTNGDLDCWGLRAAFEDDPTSPDSAFRAGPFAAVSLGIRLGCGGTQAGTWRCWAFNPGWDRYMPASLDDVTSFSAWDGACAVIDGSAVCWGAELNEFDKDGNPDFSSVSDVTQVALGHGGACVVDQTGGLWCSDVSAGEWGSVYRLDGGVEAVTRPREGMSLCALKQGDIQCYGPITYHVGKRLLGGPFRKIAAEDDFVCGISSVDDQLRCFGNDVPDHRPQ